MQRAVELAGRTVLVAGARFAGQAAVRASLAAGARVLVYDRQRPPGLEQLVAAGAEFVGDVDTVPAGVSLVVTSPGLPPDHPLLSAAAAAGIEVVGEVEFAWRLRGPDAPPWLLVTGTNGKTTTVRMLESILRADGRRALAVGNVGVSVIDAVTAGDYDVLAVEVSSFQLHWSSTLAPRAGAFLNLTADHLDWHGSMRAYAEAKTRAWGGDIAIGNADDHVVRKLLAASAARQVSFTLGTPHPGQLGLRDGMLTDLAFGAGALLPRSDVRPTGDHNVANALAAAGLALSVGVSAGAVARGLRAFVPDPHRNQPVAERAGVAWVDDSKATNADAARASLVSYPRVVWIAGGQLKGAPVDELVAQVAPRLAAVVLLGEDRGQIATALARHAPDIPVFDVASTDDGAMSEVVATAARVARVGDTVLLAPAAASYDMFTGYAQRGERFAAEVAALGPP